MKLFVTIPLLFLFSFTIFSQTNGKLIIPQTNVKLEVGGEDNQFTSATDPSSMASSQYESGDPRTGQGGDLSSCCYSYDGANSIYQNLWHSGWEANPHVPAYPHFAYIDLGNYHKLSDIWVYDIEGIGEINIYSGEPENWSSSPVATISLDSFQVWRGAEIDVTTKYIRIERVSQTSHFAEIILYGTPIPQTDKWVSQPPNIVYSSGNDIGINTNEPEAALHLIGDFKNSGKINAKENISTDQSVLVGKNVEVEGEVTAGKNISTNQNVIADGNFVAGGDISGTNLTVNNISANQVDVLTKVNIGTSVPTPPNFSLAVEKEIIAEGVTVRLVANWPDYVFQKAYDLKSLKYVEQHILENGHLHNTKSASQIYAQGGIDLKNTTIDQQEKIEEIFLHLIELQKRIQSLEIENDNLKKKLK